MKPYEAVVGEDVCFELTEDTDAFGFTTRGRFYDDRFQGIGLFATDQGFLVRTRWDSPGISGVRLAAGTPITLALASGARFAVPAVAEVAPNGVDRRARIFTQWTVDARLEPTQLRALADGSLVAAKVDIGGRTLHINLPSSVSARLQNLALCLRDTIDEPTSPVAVIP